ncbi:MAG: class I SAM-dependent methyltransferase [Actinomycetota bacterium]
MVEINALRTRLTGLVGTGLGRADELRQDVTARWFGESRTTPIGPKLERYIADTWVDEPSAARGLREATASLADRDMQIGSDQGQLLHWLATLIGASRTIEVGVFTGYSTLWTALALPPDGLVVACDVSEEWTSVGRPFWAEAGVDERIDLRLAPGEDTLSALLDDGHTASFDLAFIDADKSNYDRYYELCLQLVRPGGVIAIDNVLWGGAVADERHRDADTTAIRALNAKIGADDRVERCLVPIGDGLTLARVRPPSAADDG